ncbi:MAG: fumarylacetoacetase [Burkholderiaceae bacterium]
MKLNETHDPARRSWVAQANDPAGDFPIQNLPFAAFETAAAQGSRGGVAIGSSIVDLAALRARAPFEGLAAEALDAAAEPKLNRFMSLGPAHWSALRLALSGALAEGSALQSALAPCLVAQADATFVVPAHIGDYTDMYTSVYHATNIGKLFRPDNPLMPNFKWLPVGYHGRASSIDVSGQTFHRPKGQMMAPGADAPTFGPCKRLDYELEIGIWVGRGNALGESIGIDQVDDHVFGLCLLNDWSARDIQAWEYQPLGPFLAKNFASTISPWIVTLEALEPYRVPWTRPEADPAPLPYLESADNRARGGIDMTIEAWLKPELEGQTAGDGHRLSHSTFAHSYWSIAQMVAHHTVGGCNLQPGDLIGSGTQSGPNASEAAALIELTQGGRNPVTLAEGLTRSFLEDGDTVTLKAWCERDGRPRIGFGRCAGTVLPAR